MWYAYRPNFRVLRRLLVIILARPLSKGYALEGLAKLSYKPIDSIFLERNSL